MLSSHSNSWSHRSILGLAKHLLVSGEERLFLGRCEFLLRILALDLRVSVRATSFWFQVRAWHQAALQNLLRLAALLYGWTIWALSWDGRLAVRFTQFVPSSCRKPRVLRRVCSIVCSTSTWRMRRVPACVVHSALARGASQLGREHLLLCTWC